MIWTSHLIAGAATAQILSAQPALALGAALASHFVLDALPHWDYRLASLDQSDQQPTGRLVFRELVRSDLIKIGLDLAAGIIITGLIFSLFSWSGMVINWWLIIAGMFLAWLPDGLQIVYGLTAWSALGWLQRWHNWCHYPPAATLGRPLPGVVWELSTISLLLLIVGFF